MPDMLTISGTVVRAREEGLPISEHALRNWIRLGKIPAVRAGNKQLVYYPNLINFLTCAAGGPSSAANSGRSKQ